MWRQRPAFQPSRANEAERSASAKPHHDPILQLPVSPSGSGAPCAARQHCPPKTGHSLSPDQGIQAEARTSPSKPKGLSMSSLASCKLRGFMSSKYNAAVLQIRAPRSPRGFFRRSCTKPEAMKSGPSLGRRQSLLREALLKAKRKGAIRGAFGLRVWAS